METVELKVEMVGLHEKRLRKCFSKLKGIEKVEVDAKSEKVVVMGYVHRNKILKAIRRGGLKAEFWSSHNEILNTYVVATATAPFTGDGRPTFRSFNTFNFNFNFNFNLNFF